MGPDHFDKPLAGIKYLNLWNELQNSDRIRNKEKAVPSLRLPVLADPTGQKSDISSRSILDTNVSRRVPTGLRQRTLVGRTNLDRSDKVINHPLAAPPVSRAFASCRSCPPAPLHLHTQRRR